MSKDELHSLCDWHMEYLLILDMGTNESGILDLCVHDSRGKRFIVKSLWEMSCTIRMLEESIGLSPVMENVMTKILAVCLHKEGFREPRSCLRGVYRWDFMTAKGDGQITCLLTELNERSQSRLTPVPTIQSSHPVFQIAERRSSDCFQVIARVKLHPVTRRVWQHAGKNLKRKSVLSSSY